MLRIAIIDSGIAEGILPNKIISQHRIYNGEIFDEKPVDYVGHGTAIASILCKTALFEMLSICPGINNEGIPDRIVSSIDMYTAIKLAIELQADIINICMGTTVFSDKNKIQQICETGYKKGILIVCAESTEGIPTMPWSCQGVVRVKAKTGNTYSITISENDKIPSIEVAGNIYRIKTKEGRNFFGSGNSYATPYFINCLINSFDCNSPNIDFREKINSFFRTSENDLYEFLTGTKIENIDQNIDFVYTDIPAIGKVVLIPFSKEMHVLIRNSDKLGCKVVGVVDPVKSSPN